MTNCLRSISFHLNFHPKLMSRSFTVNRNCGPNYNPHAVNCKAQRSAFLYEFLDGRRVAYLTEDSSSKFLMPFSVQTTSLVPLPDYYNYDPILNQFEVKPRSITTDDIVLRGTTTSCSSEELPHELQSSIHQFPINVSMKTLPTPLVNQIATFHRSCIPLTEYEKTMILTADSSSKQQKTSQPTPSTSSGKPSDDQLTNIFNVLSQTLPDFFLKPQNYKIFHNNLVFQNNIRGVTTYGLPSYIQQMALLRLIGHFKFAYVKMEVLKITKHSEDGTIRVRWRIRGVSGMKIFLQFWRYRVWKYKDTMLRESDWYDGFSTFYVGSDGLVHRHVCDKMIPDNDKVEITSKTNLAAKLAFLLGAIPRPSVEDLTAVSLALVQLQHQPSTDLVKN
ncbi:hypothetical protein CHUAL_001080 [Chamberlinius hualienensis]